MSYLNFHLLIFCFVVITAFALMAKAEKANRMKVLESFAFIMIAMFIGVFFLRNFVKMQNDQYILLLLFVSLYRASKKDFFAIKNFIKAK